MIKYVVGSKMTGRRAGVQMTHNKILVVEDEPEIANLIKYSLELKNYQIIYVESGKQALEILDSDRPDLILLDVMMPDMDGFCLFYNTFLDSGLSGLSWMI